MRHLPVARWAKRALAALLCAAVVAAAPVELAAAEQLTPLTQTQDSGLAAAETTLPDEGSEGAVVVSGEVQEGQQPVALSQAQLPAGQDAAGEPAESAPAESAGASDAAAAPAAAAWAGQTVTFVDLQWKTAPLAGVEAVFTGGEGTPAVTVAFAAAGRGAYTAAAPQGAYTAVAFYPAGGAGSGAPLGGVWHLAQTDGGADAAGDAVAFAAGACSAFYYDSGANPSYWGPAPDYDPAAASGQENAAQALKGANGAEPLAGQQVYFVDLHALAGDDADPIVTVEARFIQLPHGNMETMIQQNQFLARTMYEVREGVYVAPFPTEIDTKNSDQEIIEKYGDYLYQEIAFDLTRAGGSKDEFNRHYNFRGKEDYKPVEESWGAPGWFTYEAGAMDAYYYNTKVEDSYWNAHPSGADEGLHGRLLYFDLRDYGDTPEQTLGDLYLRWPGMPSSYREYTYDPALGFKLDTETLTEGILYFQMPDDLEGLTENTVFTLSYTIIAGEHAGSHTLLFTYVPRSGRNCILLDKLWENTGEVWTYYEAQDESEGTRGIYFNNAVAAFGQVQAVVGIEQPDGSIDWMSGQEACDMLWSKDKVIGDVISTWAKGWLKLTLLDDTAANRPPVDNVWALNDVPKEYTHVMFRCAINKNAGISENDSYWFSPPLEIDIAYSYPCFFAYRYVDTNTDGDAGEADNSKLGDRKRIDGAWGSAMEPYTRGDESVDVPRKDSFQTQDDVYYANTTYYDYYSLWEQSGRALNDSAGAYAQGRDHWKRQGLLLNIAVSSYFQQADAAAGQQGDSRTKPLYFGAGGMLNENSNSGDGWNTYFGDSTQFDADKLSNNNFRDMYGLESDVNGNGNENAPLYHNTDHANVWRGNEGSRTGLLDSSLRGADGAATMNGVTAPYFSETFLRGENPLGITLGNVYKNVLFPFHRVEDEGDPFNGYWQFDSADTAVRLLQDEQDQSYYLQETKDNQLVVNNAASYLPFNDPEDVENGNMTAANYMFAQRMDIQFTVPEDGQVLMDGKDKKQDVIFEFQGDDDCWVFIDGQLVLDMGGIHDSVRGTINFAKGTWQTWRDLDNADGQEEDKDGTFTLTGGAGETHTLTMLYMERGLYSSNLKITFNFPQQNRLRVTKEVQADQVDPVFSDAIAHLGSFEMTLDTMATTGSPLSVDQSAGYVDTTTTPLYTPAADGTGAGAYKPPTDGTAAIETAAGSGSDSLTYLEVTQPAGWEGDAPADSALLTLTPDAGGTWDLSGNAFLEFQLYNGTQNNRGAELYIRLKDSAGRTCGGTARVLSYLGEANLFLPISEALVRVSLSALADTGPSDFDMENVQSLGIGLQKGTGTGQFYSVHSVAACTEWNQVLPTGFSVGDSQISDYGSRNADGTSKGYRPANGAWYTRESRDEGGSVTESVASVVQGGSFSLGDGQTAVFTDKFRVGSYIRLAENVDTDLFEVSWSIRENGQPVSFNSLLDTRTDIVNVKNPDWGYSRGETPLEAQPGTAPNDGRTETDTKRPTVNVTVEVGSDATEEEKAQAAEKEKELENAGFVYRSYLYPDNNENTPIDLEVVFHNKLKTGGYTLVKQLHESMKVGEGADARYPVGTYTFDVYYGNIAGRGLEQFLPAQPYVAGVGTAYVHQVIQITTSAATGQGEFRMDGVPAGTHYAIFERPANGATLVNVKAENHGWVVKDKNAPQGEPYRNAYVVDELYGDTLLAENRPVYTFTNKNEPFYMQIQKEWQGDAPADVEEIRIQVQRRPAGSDSEEAWEDVTKDFLGESVGEGEEAVITLTPDGNNWTQTSTKIFPTNGGEAGETAFLYEYRIVELGVGEGPLASYRVEYTQERGEDVTGADGKTTPTVIYKAINIPTGLTLEKTWVDNQNRDDTRPAAVRVQLQRSANYDPEQGEEAAAWETLDGNGKPAADNTYIELKSPTWQHSLTGLAASKTDEDGVHPYYYRLREVQVQKEGGSWAALEDQGVYEPAYSLPVTLGQAATLTVENALKTASIQVTKVDAQSTGTLLAGAEFQLERLVRDADGQWAVDAGWGPLTDTTADGTGEAAKGTLTFTGLRPGRYRLTETKAPEGYVAAFTPTDITLGAEHLNKTVSVTVQNSKPLTLAFTKVAAQDNRLGLAGAQFALYPLVCADEAHAHDALLDPESPGACWGKAQEATSNENGLVKFEGLPAGVYRLVETAAPAGYALPTGQWQLTLQADGTVSSPVAIGSPPAFLHGADGALRLTNRRPMDMPSSGGPGVPLAAALGTALMGAGLTLFVTRLRQTRGKNKHNGGRNE